jgi:aldehyde dehydrogenase (NAD+)
VERVVTPVLNWIDGAERSAHSGQVFSKLSPSDGRLLSNVARSDARDIDEAVAAATRAFPSWAAQTPVRRGDLLHELALAMRSRRDELARTVADETGKSVKDAIGETDAAIAQGLFMAGEGRRWYGRTTTSAVVNRTPIIVRQRGQHSDRECRVEGVPRACLWQHRSAQGIRGCAARRHPIRPSRA